MLNQIKQLSLFVLLLLCLFSCQSIGKKSQVTIQSKSIDAHLMTQNDKFGDKKSEVK